MLVFSKEALADLDQIWLYVAEQDVRAADGLIDTLRAKLMELARTPTIGRVRRDLWPDAYCFPVGKGTWRSGFLIFYRIRKNGIEVARILEGHRDITSEFFQ